MFKLKRKLLPILFTLFLFNSAYAQSVKIDLSVKKSDLTGAVSSVKMSDAPVATISTVSHALAGKAAGLQATTISVQPGGNIEFRIRGAASPQAGNDPLIIVDGFPVSDPGSMEVGKYDEGKKDNILASINPNDIESIEVLKDASSTAIYGACAGNGVIIVTTKKRQTGKPNVKYSGSVSTQNIARNYEVLDAHDFMLQRNRYYQENGCGIIKLEFMEGQMSPLFLLLFPDIRMRRLQILQIIRIGWTELPVPDFKRNIIFLFPADLNILNI